MKAGTFSQEILDSSKTSSNPKGPSYCSGRRLYVSTARQQARLVKPPRCRAALTVEAPSTAQARDDVFSNAIFLLLSIQYQRSNTTLRCKTSVY